MRYGDIHIMIKQTKRHQLQAEVDAFFISCFAVKTSTNFSTNKLQVQKYVRLSNKFRAYIFVTFIGGIDPFCEPAACDEIVYL